MPKLRYYGAACLVALPALYGQAWAQAQRVISLLPSATEAGQPQGFAHSAMNALTNYDWPGNVRELYNRVQRALVMAEGRWITAEDLGLESFLKKPSIRLESARTLAEREIIQLTLTEVGHNVSKAARELGISRMTLYRLMAKHDLLQ